MTGAKRQGARRGGPAVAGFRAMLPLLRPFRAPLLAALIVGLIGTAAGAVQPLVVSSMVDAFRGGFPISHAILLVGLLIASAGLGGVRQLLQQRTGERFAFRTRETLVRHVYSLPLSVLDEHRRADLISRITTDVAQTRAILSSGLVDLASNGVTVLVSVVMMALVDPVLLALTAVVVALVFFSVYLIGKRTRPSGLRLQTALGELADSLSRGLAAIKTIRATRATEREAEATVASAARALGEGMTVARLRAVIQTFTGVAVQVLLIAVVGVGALRVAAGAISVGQLTAFIMYLLLMATPISMFGSIVSMLGEAFGALSRILQLQALRPEPDVVKPELTGTGTPDERAVFHLDHVHFRYQSLDEQPKAALRDVTLTIRRGVTTAFVGPSGSGKTTLFSLLERFYEPSEGRILFQGRDVRGLSRDELRARMAYVEQDAPVLSGTVLDNLVLGSPDATEDACVAALSEVNLVPDAEAGRAYLRQAVGEIGSRLSGGERQRLAIARALITKSPILLLDEVTSNLDGKNERLIQDLIRDKDGARTILVIAHRFSTVVSADEIVLLDKGRVVARGTHPELMRDSDLYRELAAHQLLDDRVPVNGVAAAP